MIQHNKCKCSKCSQGFCHFCLDKTPVTEEVVPLQKYRYIPGARMALIQQKAERVLASLCQEHRQHEVSYERR